MTHLPVLQVAIPLLAAPVCALLWRSTAAWALALIVSWGAFVMAVLLLIQVWDKTVLSYAIGGWPPPWGIEYRLDLAGAFVLLIWTGIGAVTMCFAKVSVEQEISQPKRGLFYTAYLLCLTGLLGITLSGDAFNIFVFLEIASLSSYILISMGRDRRSLAAAFRYLIMGTIGATFILIGIGFLYAMTGTLNLMDLAQRIPADAETRSIRVAFAFLTVGIGLKLALFPLHLWLPNAYAYAPSVVTIFIAATSTKVAIYLLLRFFFSVFGTEFPFEIMTLDYVLMPLALAGIFTASIVAIFQENGKRMLAYSSVAQIGYMLLGISLASLTGVMASILHLFNHALMKGALFMALGSVAYRIGSVSIVRMAGLGRTMPWTMAAFVIAGLSLIGVPLTAGFVSKWYLVLGALERGWWPVAALILLGSLLAAVYIWRVVEAAYFRSPPGGLEHIEEAPRSLLIPTWILALANLYFGIDTSLTAGAAHGAAELLLRGWP